MCIASLVKGDVWRRGQPTLHFKQETILQGAQVRWLGRPAGGSAALVNALLVSELTEQHVALPVGR